MKFITALVLGSIFNLSAFASDPDVLCEAQNGTHYRIYSDFGEVEVFNKENKVVQAIDGLSLIIDRVDHQVEQYGWYYNGNKEEPFALVKFQDKMNRGSGWVLPHHTAVVCYR